MQSISTHSNNHLTATGVRTLVLASLGTALEYYDFVIFVFFTTVIGKLFFPGSMPDWIRQIQAFGIFAAGFMARPLGGIVMAHFGDKRGRKRMLTLSILLMAIPTLLIGLLPTYQSIGWAAPLLLLLFRVVQGIAIGGEAPGGWVFAAEHARGGQLGLTVGLQTSGLCGGVMIGSLVAAGVSGAFSQGQIISGFWRIPFLLGGIFGIIGMSLRRWLSETPVFEEMRKRAEASRELPLRVVLRSHGRAVVASVMSFSMLMAGIMVVVLMGPALLQRLFQLSPRSVQSANLAATAVLCVSTVAVGAATDRFGLRRVATPVLLLLIDATYGLYFSVARMQSALLPFYILAGIGLGAVALPPIIAVRAFPSLVRFTGVSFSSNVAYALSGGLTPLFVSWLAHLNRMNPAHFIAATTALWLLATLMAPNERFSNSQWLMLDARSTYETVLTR